MYASIDDKFVIKNRVEAQDNERLLWPNLTDEMETLEVKGNTITVCVSNELGYFSVEFELSLDAQVKILENVVKTANKVKTLLESVK